MKKLESMHYQFLRLVVRDWTNALSRPTLDKIGRAAPSVWSQYVTASTVMNCVNQCKPERLYNLILSQSYKESRRPGILKFRETNRLKMGKNMLINRLKNVFNKPGIPAWFGANKHEVTLKQLFLFFQCMRMILSRA